MYFAHMHSIQQTNYHMPTLTVLNLFHIALVPSIVQSIDTIPRGTGLETAIFHTPMRVMPDVMYYFRVNA